MQVELTDEQALALAELCKRAFIERVRPFAADDAEAWQMLEALEQVGRALAQDGYAPR
jgi:hypothetical protein